MHRIVALTQAHEQWDLRSRPNGQRVNVERAMGIEPTALAWEARVLPLYDARIWQN